MWNRFVTWLKSLFSETPVPAPKVDPVLPEASFGPPPPKAVLTPLDGESFISYAYRVTPVIGGDINALGGLLGNSSPWFARTGGYRADGSNWLVALDEYFHPANYLTTVERASETAALLRDAQAANQVFTGPVDVASLTLEDKLFMARTNIPFTAFSGTATQIHAAVNEGGSAHASEMAAFDVAGYNGPLKQYVPAPRKRDAVKP